MAYFWYARPPNPQSVTNLLDAGCNVNQINQFGDSVLMAAACNPTTSVDVLQVLINKGADVNVTGWNGQNVLRLSYKR